MEVTTIFVAGLPPDATPRELDNLCRRPPREIILRITFIRNMIR